MIQVGTGESKGQHLPAATPVELPVGRDACLRHILRRSQVEATQNVYSEVCSASTWEVFQRLGDHLKLSGGPEG